LLENLKICSTCRYQDFLGNFKTCQKCRNQNQSNKSTQIKENIKKCKICNNSASENEYCGKHQLNKWLDDTEKEGYKACVNYVRGCKKKLDKNYMYSKCESCLKKDREKEKNTTEKINELCKIQNYNTLEINSEINILNKLENMLASIHEENINHTELIKIINNFGTQEYIKKYEIELNSYKMYLEQLYEKNNDIELINVINSFNDPNMAFSELSHEHMKNNSIKLLNEIKNELTERIKCQTMLCINCLKTYHYDNFINKHEKLTKWCKKCRQKMREIDTNRKERIRDYTEYEQTQKRKDAKIKWKNDNYNKLVEYQMKYKASQMEKKGDEYWNEKSKRTYKNEFIFLS
jgi:hypothetical protein